jgi:hypothetical protein
MQKKVGGLPLAFTPEHKNSSATLANRRRRDRILLWSAM